MITDTDIEKMKLVFVTKEDLMPFTTKTDLKDSVDGLYVLIESLRQDFNMELKGLREDMRMILKNHESRITKIEEKADYI